MNILKNPELNLGFNDYKLGCLYYFLGKLYLFKTALMQYLFAWNQHTTALLDASGGIWKSPQNELINTHFNHR